MLPHTPSKRAELHLIDELQQHLGIRLAQAKAFPLLFDVNVVLKRHEFTRDADLIGEVDQGLATLLLFDFIGALQDGVERTECVDQFSGRLRPDTWRARHVIRAVADQSLRVDHFVRRDTELLHHRLGAKRAVLHRIIKLDLSVDDELHQILVGRDDLHRSARRRSLARIGSDQVVGLEAAHLDAWKIERARGVTDHGKLRDEIFRRRRAMRFVLRIELVAECHFALVEDNREVRRRLARFHLLQKLPQHVAKAGDSADRQTIARTRQWRQRMIRAENVAGAVDQEETGRVFLSHAADIVSLRARVSRPVAAGRASFRDALRGV